MSNENTQSISRTNKMQSLKEFFQTDPDWNNTKKKIKKIKTKTLMTKTEYLKYIGAKHFTEDGYKDYVKNFKGDVK